MSADDDFWLRDGSFGAGPPLTPQLIADANARFGIELPQDYLAVMSVSNGGTPLRDGFPVTGLAWAPDHIAIMGFYELGESMEIANDIAREAGYPQVGVYIADCSPYGSDYIALDYQGCGPEGEPAVVHVAAGAIFQVTGLATDFRSFCEQLRPISEFPSSIELRRERALDRVRHAEFSALLAGLLDFHPDKSLGDRLRHVAAEIVHDRGDFVLADDARSWLLYDLQFLLASLRLEVSSPAGYLHVYDTILAKVGPSHFGTGQYERQYVEDWLVDTIQRGRLEATSVGLRFTAEAELDVLDRLDRA